MSEGRDPDSPERLKGLLIGTAVGDSLGLPAEGLSSRRIRRLYGGTWRHRFVLGRGMISDDTEHTIFVAQSLLSHPDSITEFRRSLAWKLRLWLIGLPAGIGYATLRSIIKLWLGVPPAKSGVYSAGNGPAMRSAIIGAYFFNSPEALKTYVEASTHLTHKDPRALTGALAVAQLASWIMSGKPSVALSANEVLRLLESTGDSADYEWREILQKMRVCYERKSSVQEFTAALNLSRGVTGYIYHTVPVAIYSWMRHYGDFKRTIEAALDCGGDTDTVAAIAGALAGATVGESLIPKDWVEAILDWPFDMETLRELGESLAGRRSEQKIKNYLWLARLPRNILFIVVAVIHVIRRAMPPY